MFEQRSNSNVARFFLASVPASLPPPPPPPPLICGGSSAELKLASPGATIRGLQNPPSLSNTIFLACLSEACLGKGSFLVRKNGITQKTAVFLAHAHRRKTQT
jgi:hypothetical protein